MFFFMKKMICYTAMILVKKTSLNQLFLHFFLGGWQGLVHIYILYYMCIPVIFPICLVQFLSFVAVSPIKPHSHPARKGPLGGCLGRLPTARCQGGACKPQNAWNFIVDDWCLCTPYCIYCPIVFSIDTSGYIYVQYICMYYIYMYVCVRAYVCACVSQAILSSS